MGQGTEELMTREKMAEYLSNYLFGARLLGMNKYEKDFFDSNYSKALNAEDEALVKAKMFEVKMFVTSLPPDERKLFLYYYYIKGETVEKCGELLGVSRRTAYRMKTRALDYAAAKYKKFTRHAVE